MQLLVLGMALGFYDSQDTEQKVFAFLKEKNTPY